MVETILGERMKKADIFFIVLSMIIVSIASISIYKWMKPCPEINLTKQPKPDTLYFTIRDTLPDYDDYIKWKFKKHFGPDTASYSQKLDSTVSRKFTKQHETKKYKAKLNIWAKAPPDSVDLLINIKPQIIEREKMVVCQDTIIYQTVTYPISTSKKLNYVGAGSFLTILILFATGAI
jgi:hypothetical protein